MSTKVRMKDIAQIAGVSTVTVSKALAGMRGVSENKRREILRLADEMGYVPPEKTQPERVEGYRIHILTAERFYGKLPSMYDRMMELLSDEIRRAGCMMTSDIISDRAMNDMQMPDGINPRAQKGERADGVVILGELDAAYRDYVLEHCSMPCVFIDSNPPLERDCVISDGFHGAWQLTNYLIEHGHRKIAYVGTILASVSITERYLGYVRAMMEHGISIPGEWIIDDRDPKTGELKADTLFRIPKELPDAFLCNCDLSAAILFEKLKQNGIRCPEDVSVVGFDNFHYPDISPQRFTTYEVDARKMAHDVIRIMLRRIRGDYFRKRIFVVSGHIVEGDSVGNRTGKGQGTE